MNCGDKQAMRERRLAFSIHESFTGCSQFSVLLVLGLQEFNFRSPNFPVGRAPLRATQTRGRQALTPRTLAAATSPHSRRGHSPTRRRDQFPLVESLSTLLGRHLHLVLGRTPRLSDGRSPALALPAELLGALRLAHELGTISDEPRVASIATSRAVLPCLFLTVVIAPGIAVVNAFIAATSPRSATLCAGVWPIFPWAVRSILEKPYMGGSRPCPCRSAAQRTHQVANHWVELDPRGTHDLWRGVDEQLDRVGVGVVGLGED